MTEWGLSTEGLRRARAMLGLPWTQHIGRIISSPERKALQTAELLGAHRSIEIEVRAETYEMDRSSTGFVEPETFDHLVEEFFAHPTRSIDGWETAEHAQKRIVRALSDLLSGPDRTSANNDGVAVIGHGGVGTLWYCHLAGLPIAREHDQSFQGHYYATLDDGRPVHRWSPVS